MKRNLVNVDALINTVREGFGDIETYNKDAKNRKKWYSMSDHEKTWRERNAHHADSALSNLCDILRADWRKLQTIARLARKWEEKRNWQLCFPAEAHAEKILDYIQKDNDKPWTGPNINYIHWKINTGAYRKDYEWSLKRNKKTA